MRKGNAEQLWRSHSKATSARQKLLLAKACSRTGSRRQSQKKVWFWSFLKQRLKGKLKAPKTRNIRKSPCTTSTHFLRAFPQNTESWRYENETKLSCETTSPQMKVGDVKTKLSCETSLKNCKLKMWKRSFRARCPSKSESWRYESDAFVRDVPQKVKVEDVKTKLWCQMSLWKLSFRARHPSKSQNCKKLRCENEAFVQDAPQKVKMWNRSFHAGRPSKTESWRCENQPFVRDVT